MRKLSLIFIGLFLFSFSVSADLTFREKDTGTASFSSDQYRSADTSIKLTTVVGNDFAAVTIPFEGTLDDLTSFDYWDYIDSRQGGTEVEIFIDIWLDCDDNDTLTWNDVNCYMQAEPYYTYGSRSEDQWYNSDAMDMKWSTVVGPDDPHNAPTLDDLINDPSSYNVQRFINGSGHIDWGPLKVLRIEIRVGYGSTWPNFIGYLDDVSINGDSYDFSRPTTVYVDDDYDAFTLYDPVSQDWKFNNIQDAIDSVEGSIVNVAAGTYTEDLTIDETKTNLELVGADKTTTTIKAVSNVPIASWPLVVPNIDVRADGVTIHGFTIEGPNYASGYYSSGIVIEGSSVEIYDNNFKTPPGNDAFADEVSQAIQTYYEGSVPGVDVSGLNIHDNTFTSLGTGSAGYEGIYVNLDTGSGSITIQNNQFTGDLIRAITSERSNTQITSNTVITDLAPGLLGGYLGIYVGRAGGTQSSVSVTGNTVKGSTTGKGFLQGIRIGSSSQTDLSSISVIDNTVEGNYNGIYVKNNADGVVVNYNIITSNIMGVQNDDGANQLDAQYNYWGSCDGPSGEGSGSGDAVSTNVDYDPWLGICIENKTDVTCAYELNNVELEAYLNTSQNIDEAWFSIFINGVNTNHTVTPVDNWVSYVLSESELSGEENVKWNVYAEDEFGNVFNNSWKEFYVRNKTELFVDPSNPIGLDDWYITEPVFSLMNDPIEGGNIYYMWDSIGPLLYSTPFDLEDIPNPPPESAGTLELTYWTDFNICGNETEQIKMFYIDLINTNITDLSPEDGSTVYNNLRPEISAYLDEVYGSNSGVNPLTVIMKVDGSPVTPDINPADSIDYTVSYTPVSDFSLGAHTVYVYVEDNAGRASELTWEFDIQTTSSFSMEVTSPDDKVYGNRRVPIIVSLDSDVELLEYQDNGRRWKRLCRNCDGYDRLKSFREGEHELVIRATDEFGWTKEETINFEVDSRKPRISRIEPKRKSTTNGENFKVKYTENNLKNVEVSVSDGVDTATYGLEDCEAGRNKECSTVLVYTVKVDTTDPILVVDEPNNGITYGRRVPFDLEVTNEKVKIIEYRDNLGRWRRLCTRCDSYDRTKSFKRGIHTVNIRAVDYAGNSDQETINFEVAY